MIWTVQNIIHKIFIFSHDIVVVIIRRINATESTGVGGHVETRHFGTGHCGAKLRLLSDINYLFFVFQTFV